MLREEIPGSAGMSACAAETKNRGEYAKTWHDGGGCVSDVFGNLFERVGGGKDADDCVGKRSDEY